MSAIPTADDIRARVSVAAFGGPLISNIYRGLVAEIIVGAALGSEWQLCSGDWRGWDFEHLTGLLLEVKQSAARQTWTGTRKATMPIFDIRARTRAVRYIFCCTERTALIPLGLGLLGNDPDTSGGSMPCVITIAFFISC